MDENYRKYHAGRYGSDDEKKEPTLIEKIREMLVPGSGKGVKYPQNKQESDRLKKMEEE